MPDTKKYTLVRSELVGDPEEGIDQLRLTWLLDDGTYAYDTFDGYMASLDPDDSIQLLAEALEVDVSAHHTGGRDMAVGSYDVDNTVVT